jgi:hypothetical protein
LRMENESFRVACVGGVFEAGDLIINPLREEVRRTARHALVAAPLESPMVGAARMAQSHFLAEQELKSLESQI